jgi:hypothetical protein
VTLNRSQDEGSVLLLGVGMVVLAALFVAVLADVAVLRLARQDLLARADATALAAVQAVDVDALMRTGYVRHYGELVVPVDEQRARQAASVHLRSAAPHAGSLQGVRLEAFAVQRGSVSVDLSARVRPPFTQVVLRLVGGDGQVPVRARARARTHVG